MPPEPAPQPPEVEGDDGRDGHATEAVERRLVGEARRGSYGLRPCRDGRTHGGPPQAAVHCVREKAP